MLNFIPTEFPHYCYMEEYWKPITSEIVPGILPIYYISTWGRVYNSYSNKYYPNENNHSERYVVLWLKLSNHDGIKIYLHILMMWVFRYFEGCEDTDKYEVNHIDGIKYHNWLWNLEWVTPQQNIIHSRLTGLNPSCGDSVLAKITDEQARLIAQKIANGDKPSKIVKELQLYMPDINIKNIYDSMVSGRAWRKITSEYDFTNRYKVKVYFTDDQVNQICLIFQNYGTDISYKEILDMINYDYTTYTEHDMKMLRCTISNIRLKKYKKEICAQYKY